MDINKYLKDNEYILKILIDYCKEIEEYKKEIEREEDEIKSIIINYLNKNDRHAYETKYYKAIIRYKEDNKTRYDFASMEPHNNINKFILEIKHKNK